jgi:hypothetical protein
VLTVMEGSDVLYSPTCVEVLQSVVLPWSYLCVCVCVCVCYVRGSKKDGKGEREGLDNKLTKF